jgi:hypothetical protein
MRVRPERAAEAAAFVRRLWPALAPVDGGNGRDGAADPAAHLSFRLPQQGLDLADVFARIEDARQALGIEEYSVSQTTLEQVRSDRQTGHTDRKQKWLLQRGAWTVPDGAGTHEDQSDRQTDAHKV